MSHAKTRERHCGRNSESGYRRPSRVKGWAIRGDPFAALRHTKVYRRVPEEVRATLDAAILARPEDCTAPQHAAGELDLATRYGVSAADIRRYSATLCRLARPFMASALASTLTRSLPRRVRRGLADTNRLLSWSRLVQHLTDHESRPLTVAELAKVSGLLRYSRADRHEEGRQRRCRGGSTVSRSAPSESIQGGAAPSNLAALVRAVYGLNVGQCDAPTGR